MIGNYQFLQKILTDLPTARSAVQGHMNDLVKILKAENGLITLVSVPDRVNENFVVTVPIGT
jgi:hypothetical protein